MRTRQKLFKNYLTACAMLMLLFSSCTKTDEFMPEEGEYYIKFTMNGQSNDFRLVDENQGSSTTAIAFMPDDFDEMGTFTVHGLTFGAGSNDVYRTLGREFKFITVSIARYVPITIGKHINYEGSPDDDLDMETHFQKTVLITVNYFHIKDGDPQEAYINIDERNGVSEVNILEHNADYIRGTFRSVLNHDVANDRDVSIPITGEFYLPASEIEVIN